MSRRSEYDSSRVVSDPGGEGEEGVPCTVGGTVYRRIASLGVSMDPRLAWLAERGSNGWSNQMNGSNVSQIVWVMSR
jgi:hypothetical protein